MEDRGDNELMALLIERNSLALKVLYRRYEVAVFNFLLRCSGNREIAQELIQETFTRIWFAAHTFDPERGHFKGWLYAIALNLARDEMSKKRYTYRYVDPDELDSCPQAGHEFSAPGPDALLEQSEIRRNLVDVLALLKPHLREVVVLKNYQYLTFAEISQVLRTPESTIKARYHKAIEVIKRQLCKEVTAHVREV